MDKKNKGLGIIIAMGKKPSIKEESVEPVESEGSDSSAFDDAAQTMFDAVKEDDFESFKGALKTAIGSCGYEEE